MILERLVGSNLLVVVLAALLPACESVPAPAPTPKLHTPR